MVGRLSDVVVRAEGAHPRVAGFVVRIGARACWLHAEDVAGVEQGRIQLAQSRFDLVDVHRADAVIYHTIRFCDPYTFRYEENKEIFEKRDIPFLQLHTDFGKADTGQLTTRVGALVEIIRQKKKTKELVNG